MLDNLLTPLADKNAKEMPGTTVGNCPQLAFKIDVIHDI